MSSKSQCLRVLTKSLSDCYLNDENFPLFVDFNPNSSVPSTET